MCGYGSENGKGDFIDASHPSGLKLGLFLEGILLGEERSAAMTNPMNRGTAPGRAQPDYLRPGTFESGHEKYGGRKSGAPNAISADHRKALVEAAYRVGMAGNGEQGIVRYFRFLARYHPRVFAPMLMSMLPWEFLEGGTAARRTMATLDEINEWARRYAGIEEGKAWTFPIGELMEIAVENPKAFGKRFMAAFLRPPTARDRRRASILIQSTFVRAQDVDEHCST